MSKYTDLEIQIMLSTTGLCSHQSLDIYTPSCIGAPSYYLWPLEGGIKQQTDAAQNRTA